MSYSDEAPRCDFVADLFALENWRALSPGWGIKDRASASTKESTAPWLGASMARGA